MVELFLSKFKVLVKRKNELLQKSKQICGFYNLLKQVYSKSITTYDLKF